MSLFRSCVLVTLTGCQCLVPVQECVGPCGSIDDWCARAQLVSRCANAQVCGLASRDVTCDQLVFWPTFPLSPSCSQPLRDAVDQGRVAFDETAARNCLQSLSTSCGAHPECDRIFRGSLPLGAECHTRFDCAEGGWCDLATCPGTCRRQSLAGETVASSDACGTTSSEQLVDGGVRCRNASQPGDTCSEESLCTFGFQCRLDGGCEEAPPGSLGRTGRGERCTGLFIGIPLTLCAGGLACHLREGETEGVCGARYAVGEDCTGDAAGCVAGSSCKERRCVVLQAQGGSCTTTFDCQEGLACRAGRCGVRAPAGEPCGWSYDCDEALSCVEGSCATPVCGG